VLPSEGLPRLLGSAPSDERNPILLKLLLKFFRRIGIEKQVLQNNRSIGPNSFYSRIGSMPGHDDIMWAVAPFGPKSGN
jgi:hypothetical protein